MPPQKCSLVHRDLPKDSIRLLELLELTGVPDQVMLRLTTYRLEDAPEFNALSYVWGNSSKTARVPCWGERDSQLHEIEIGINLCIALPYLKAASSKPIWIDAICIDQENVSEIEAVVPMMGDYYGRAAEVLIWLGPAKDRSDLAVDVLRYLCYPSERDVLQATICRQDETLEPSVLAALLSAVHNGEYIHHPEADTVRLGIPTQQHALWQALPALYQRPWFFRVWTFQEAVLATNARVLCGDREMDWPAFRNIGNQLSETQLMWIGRESGQFTPLRTFQHFNPNGEGFLFFLQRVRDRECTLKEDRVYGLLALAPPSIRASVEVVYSKDDSESYTHVYRATAAALLKEVPLELVLDFATSSAKADKLPSWVPDWSMRQTSDTQPSRFKADATHFSQRSWSVDADDQRVLIVQGQEIDVIEEVIDDYVYDWPKDARGIDGPADKMRQWLNCCESLARRTLSSSQAAADALWQTLTAYSTTGSQYKDSPSIIRRGFAAHRKRLGELRDSVQIAQTKLSSADMQALGPLIARIGRIMRGKVLFSTVRGTIGIAERGVAAGDMVCVLFSACKHYILRPYETGEYALMAVAYVHGFMEDVELALNLRDGHVPIEVRARKFRIR